MSSASGRPTNVQMPTVTTSAFCCSSVPSPGFYVPDFCLCFTDFFPPPELVEERGLARPVVAGIVATICFLAAAVLFSTMAACFVNKQRRRKLKRKRGDGTVLVIRSSTISGAVFKEKDSRRALTGTSGF